MLDSERARKLFGLGVVDPKHWLKRLWDAIVCILAFYACLEVPYRIGYPLPPDSVDKNAVHLRSLYQAMDIAIDFVFCFDFFISFITGYEDLENGQLVHEKGRILKKYAQGLCLPDFLASLPTFFSKPAHGMLGPMASYGDIANYILFSLRLMKSLKLLHQMQEIKVLLEI